MVIHHWYDHHFTNRNFKNNGNSLNASGAFVSNRFNDRIICTYNFH